MLEWSQWTDDHWLSLMHMLMIISPLSPYESAWLPHGRSWRILQQKAFEERVIPLYFRHGRYSSFARQVNGWGFKRITHGSDYNSYYRKSKEHSPATGQLVVVDIADKFMC